MKARKCFTEWKWLGRGKSNFCIIKINFNTQLRDHPFRKQTGIFFLYPWMSPNGGGKRRLVEHMQVEINYRQIYEYTFLVLCQMLFLSAAK